MKYTLSVFFFILVSFNTAAKTNSPASEANQKSLSAVTVFIDVNKFNRRKKAAKKMTESHQDFASFGYRLLAISPYTENGDLEGFFVSYQKP